MKRRTLLISSDSELDEHEFIICQNGTLKTSFKLRINIEEEEVSSIKWRILRRLNLLDE